MPPPPAATIAPARPAAITRPIPAAPDRFVRRTRLEARLGDEHRRSVTLVSGLPGAGKTTLVASWLRAEDRPAAWVGLDERHDEPGRLVRSVLRALSELGALPNPAPRRRWSDAALVDLAVDTLAPGPWVLVLDDVHHLRSGEALGALRLLLERVPPRLDLVLCTRADPPVALGRMRLDGRLGEIRNADLEFTLDEAAELLASQGVELRADDVRALWSRTQGWAAGLRLAAGALAAAGDPHELVVSATATEAAVGDYLLEEVLDRQDPDVQSFLLRTSVAERVTPDLAALLTADHRAGERLADLERSGIFLVDTDDGWYRYHALFADLLRATLRRRDPDLVPEMHGRAAGWLMANGRPADAERHAGLAGDWPLVGRLAIDRWLAATLDDSGLLPDPNARVPAGAVRETPALALVAAAAACRSGDRDAADLHRDHLDSLLGPIPERATRSSGGLHRHLLDLAHGWAFGPEDRAGSAADALASSHEIDAGTLSVRRLARLRSAEQAVDEGRFDTAVAALDQLAGGLDEDWMAAEAAAIAALVTAAIGSPSEASRRVAAVLAVRDGLDTHPTARRAAHLAASLACAQRGERRTAMVHLDEAATSPAPASHLLQTVIAAVRAALGPASSSSAWLDSTTARHPLAAQALIACGALEVVDPDRRVVAVGGPAERAVARARQDLARSAPEAARRGLERALRRDHPSVHERTIVEAHVLSVLASDACHDLPAAAAHLEAALDLVADSDVRAPVLDHGAALQTIIDRVDLTAHRGLVLELRDHLQKGGGQAARPVEVLTDRERAVLQYLPTLMSNSEIASGLHLSINTVKSHLKAVYRKLGVDSRRDAVLRGRELELI